VVRAPSRRVVSIVAAAAVVGLYLVVVLLGVFEDQSQGHAQYSQGEAAETLVVIVVTDVQPAKETLSVNVTLHPGAGLVDGAGHLTDDLSVTLHPSAQQVSLTFPRGRTVSTASVDLIAEGEFQQWPFDRYAARNLVVEVAQGRPADNRLINTRVGVAGSVPGWTVDEFEARYPASGPQSWDITLHRDSGAILFSVMLCLVLVALPVMALYVATLTVRGKRPFYPPMIGWFAIMLFAVVPLRNLFPGAPPLGGWIDRAVVIWVLAALVAAQAMYVYAWRTEGRKKDP
jgi:hypothetical protein